MCVYICSYKSTYVCVYGVEWRRIDKRLDIGLLWINKLPTVSAGVCCVIEMLRVAALQNCCVTALQCCGVKVL